MGSIALSDLKSSNVKITRSTTLRPVPAQGSPEELSHSHCTDHMVTVRWTDDQGWHTPEVRPFENLSIPPTASCLHYATECFEGMKVYRGYDGQLRLFRPDCNGERLAMSAQRTSLPGFGYEELKSLVARLLQIDGPRWLPKDQPGRFLYIRPTMIGSGTQLGVQKPKEALLFIIAVAWPDLSKPSGLKLLASGPDTIRAWPGGFGYAKLGANYGPSLAAHAQAAGVGFDQVLWLFGPQREVTEAGASNFFMVVEDKETKKLELITAPLDNQLILPGVTRRSVLELAKDRLSGAGSGAAATGLQPVEVVERSFTIGEVEEAWKDGRIVEAFVSGTAYFITPVQLIRNGDTDINLEADAARAGYAAQIKSWLGAIMYGKEKHEWGYVIENENGQ